MSKRKSKPVVIEMATELTNSGAATDALLDGILADLTLKDEKAAAEESIEPVNAAPAVDDAIIEGATEAVAEVIEREELYAAQSTETEPVSEGDRPTEVAPTEGKKQKKAREPKPAVEKAPRVTYHGNRRSAVLEARVGGKSADMLVFELSDATLSPEALAAKQAAIRDDIDNKLAKKVAEKLVMLFKDVAANVPIKNDVMATAFKVLHRDGFLTSGDKGNLQQELRQRLSVGTTRSQANQMFALLPFLKIVNKSEKGKFEPNPESALLPTINSVMGLA